MKTDLFQSCVHCCVFQICWPIECSTFTASNFRIWNSSTGIPSPPLALLAVMLPKAHLTSHFRMSGSRWVIRSGLWRSFFVQFFCVFLPPYRFLPSYGCESWTIKKTKCQRIDAFEIVVLEKSLKSSLNCKEIKPVDAKGNQPWIFTRRTDAEVEAPMLGHAMLRGDWLEKTLMMGKIEGRMRRRQQRMRWFGSTTN